MDDTLAQKDVQARCEIPLLPRCEGTSPEAPASAAVVAVGAVKCAEKADDLALARCAVLGVEV